jgi:hypothetical protein
MERQKEARATGVAVGLSEDTRHVHFYASHKYGAFSYGIKTGSRGEETGVDQTFGCVAPAVLTSI